MASLTQETFIAAQEAETQLLAALNSTELVSQDMGIYLARYRTEVDKVIMNDLQLAQEHDGEQALWHLHARVHKRFQKALRMLLKEQKPVEYRKTAKSYLDFIKDSQIYYRGFIQRLVSRFGGIPELNAVASNLGLEAIAAANVSKFPEKMRRTVLLSCHQALIYLGDLSRYREEGLNRQDCNWAPSIGYYDLAGAINPNSGASHHQLAVIARHIGDHMRVTYHFYRALATEEPDVRAQDNLELEIRKIKLAHMKGKLLPQGDHATSQISEMTVAVFMLLHSRLYSGADVSGTEELENEAITQLELMIKLRSVEGTLNKLVLTNIAAQYFAGVKFQNPPNAIEDMQAFVSFLRFNIKTFFTLLDILHHELTQQMDAGSSSGARRPGSGLKKVTAVMRRILSAVRHYSSWLTCNIDLLVGYTGPSAPYNLASLVKDFFRMYASTMTILASTYNAESLPMIEYLLEEDEDTIAFKPFEKGSSRYLAETTNTLKPKFHTHGVERHHPNFEMLARVRDLLTDSVKLAIKEEVPFDLVDGTAFAYRGEVEPSEHTLSANGHQATPTSANLQCDATPRISRPPFDAIAYLEDHISRASSSSTSVAEETTMGNMFNGLVDLKDTTNESQPRRSRLSPHGWTYDPLPAPLPDYGPIGTPPRRHSSQQKDFGPIGTPPKATGNETSYGVIGTRTAQELARRLSAHSSPIEASPPQRLASLYHSPFAPPLPGSAPSSRPGTAPSPSQRQDTQTNGYHTIDSSASSIQEPSSIGVLQPKSLRAYVKHSPRNEPSIWHHENRGASVNRLSWGVNHADGNTFDGSQFLSSSNVLSGSMWDGGRPAAGMMPTPPNGQGRG